MVIAEVAMELIALETAVSNWWLSKKPDSWSIKEYQRRPGFNCKTTEEEDLAYVASRWLLHAESRDYGYRLEFKRDDK
jgi:hypothetical protein